MKHHCRSAQVWRVFSMDLTVLPAHPHVHSRNRNEPYLPLPAQPQLVLIYRPRRDGRLSRPWCEVAPAEIRTCNLPIANPALYHTATSAPRKQKKWKQRSERSKHCALAVLRRSHKFSPHRRPLRGGAGRPKFIQLETVTTFTYRPNLVKIDERNFELSW